MPSNNSLVNWVRNKFLTNKKAQPVELVVVNTTPDTKDSTPAAETATPAAAPKATTPVAASKTTTPVEIIEKVTPRRHQKTLGERHANQKKYETEGAVKRRYKIETREQRDAAAAKVKAEQEAAQRKLQETAAAKAARKAEKKAVEEAKKAFALQKIVNDLAELRNYDEAGKKALQDAYSHLATCLDAARGKNKDITVGEFDKNNKVSEQDLAAFAIEKTLISKLAELKAVYKNNKLSDDEQRKNALKILADCNKLCRKYENHATPLKTKLLKAAGVFLLTVAAVVVGALAASLIACAFVPGLQPLACVGAVLTAIAAGSAATLTPAAIGTVAASAVLGASTLAGFVVDAVRDGKLTRGAKQLGKASKQLLFPPQPKQSSWVPVAEPEDDFLVLPKAKAKK